MRKLIKIKSNKMVIKLTTTSKVKYNNLKDGFDVMIT